MSFSAQQQDVIDSSGNLAVNAIAGSGKTTTLVGYAEKRKSKRGLYLAFNNSVKQEALAKFRRSGVTIRVETAHSLALSYFRSRSFALKRGNYKAFDIKNVLKYKQKDAIEDMKFGRHIAAMFTAFCNSTVARVAELDYLNMLQDGGDIDFVTQHYEGLVAGTRKFLGLMDRGEIEMEHDFYLKKFQLSNPVLTAYDYILFDEGQDASAVMLDVLMNQKGDKVIVGDENQQIYSWRYAINALANTGFVKKSLDTSYRFDQSVGDLAKGVLQTKNWLLESLVPPIKGVGQPPEKFNSRATLGRTNGAVLVDAVDRLIDTRDIGSVYFEGNFNSYTYADEGGSVFDVLNLYTGNRKGIRDPMIKPFQDFSQLEEYAESAGDPPLKGIIEVVKKYGKDLPAIVKEIKSKHVKDGEKDQADMIYSTVHKAKGMEYDEVTLLGDFLGENRLQDLLARKDVDLNIGRLIEDINILYVAITRTKGKLIVPADLIPKELNVNNSPSIELIHLPLEYVSMIEEDPIVAVKPVVLNKEHSYEKRRKPHSSAHSSWSSTDDENLELMFCKHKSVQELADHFGRSKGAIYARIKRLELREKYYD